MRPTRLLPRAGSPEGKGKTVKIYSLRLPRAVSPSLHYLPKNGNISLGNSLLKKEVYVLRNIVLFLLTAIIPLAAFGQSQGVEISPYGAYRYGGEVEADDNALFEDDVDVDESVAFGLRVDVPLTRNLQLEFLAARQNSEFIEEGELFGGDTRLVDVAVDYYHLGILWQWGNGQMHPYLVTSLGIGRLDIDLPEVSPEEKFSWSFGGGVKIMTSDHVGIRVENRWFWTNTDPGNNDDDCWDDGEWEDDCWDYTDDLVQGEISVGVVLSF